MEHKELFKKMIAGDKDALHEGAENLLPDKAFNQVLDACHDIARKTKLLPVVAVITQKGNRYASDVLRTKDHFRDNKHEAMRSLGAKYGKDSVVAVFLSSEAWIGEGISSEQLEQGDYPAPSKDPKRVEALITAGMTLDGRTNMVVDKIVKGKPKPYLYNPYKYGTEKTLETGLLLSFFQGYTSEAVNHLREIRDSLK